MAHPEMLQATRAPQALRRGVQGLPIVLAVAAACPPVQAQTTPTSDGVPSKPLYARRTQAPGIRPYTEGAKNPTPRQSVINDARNALQWLKLERGKLAASGPFNTSDPDDAFAAEATKTTLAEVDRHITTLTAAIETMEKTKSSYPQSPPPTTRPSGVRVGRPTVGGDPLAFSDAVERARAAVAGGNAMLAYLPTVFSGLRSRATGTSSAKPSSGTVSQSKPGAGTVSQAKPIAPAPTVSPAPARPAPSPPRTAVQPVTPAPAPILGSRFGGPLANDYATRAWQGQATVIGLKAGLDSLSNSIQEASRAGRVVPETVRRLQQQLAKTIAQAEVKLAAFNEAVARGDYRGADARWAEFTRLVQESQRLHAQASGQLATKSDPGSTVAGTTVTVDVAPDIARAPGPESSPPPREFITRPPPASPFR